MQFRHVTYGEIPMCINCGVGMIRATDQLREHIAHHMMCNSPYYQIKPISYCWWFLINHERDLVKVTRPAVYASPAVPQGS